MATERDWTRMTDEYDMLSVGSVPLNPNVVDFDDADGKVVLYVKDTDEGRSLYLSMSLYGEMSRTYEVRYDDFAEVVTKMMGEVTMANSEDEFMKLLGGN